MTTKEFDSYARGIAIKTIKLELGKMTVEEFAKEMKIVLGKDLYSETKRDLTEEL